MGLLCFHHCFQQIEKVSHEFSSLMSKRLGFRFYRPLSHLVR